MGDGQRNPPARVLAGTAEGIGVAEEEGSRRAAAGGNGIVTLKEVRRVAPLATQESRELRRELVKVIRHLKSTDGSQVVAYALAINDRDGAIGTSYVIGPRGDRTKLVGTLTVLQQRVLTHIEAAASTGDE